MFRLVGALTVSPLEVRLNVSHMNRWPMSNACVMEPRVMRLTLVMLLAFGVLLGPVFLVVGAVVMVIGIATWLIDDARAYSSASEPTDGAHH